MYFFVVKVFWFFFSKKNALALALSASVCVGRATAEDYPSRKVEVIVPYSAGSGDDLIARVFAQALQSQLNVPFVVENRVGATGLIGSMMAARSSNDGYTIMVNANPPFASTPLYQKAATYDPVASFVPIARVGAVPMLLVTAGSSPVKTFQELKAYTQAHPDKAYYATNGNGSPAELDMEYVKNAVDMKIQEVIYKDTSQMMTDTMAGQVLTTLLSLATSEELVRAGKLRVLAVGTKARLPKFPDVPTFAELIGQPDYQATVWYGFFAPAGVPSDRVDRLFTAISKASATPTVLEGMAQLSIVPELQSPKEFAVSLRRDALSAAEVVNSLAGRQEGQH